MSEELGTNQLQVLTVASSLGDMLGPVQVDPAVLTPQGDGVNEETTISYTLFRVLEAAQVDVSVFTLSGDRVLVRKARQSRWGISRSAVERPRRC